MIFNIQRFSLHDGDGVRTVVFFKGCPLRCFWCANPEGQEFGAEVFYDARKCLGCRDCLRAAGEGELWWENGLRIRRIGLEAGRYRTICPSEALTVAGEDKTVGDIMEAAEKDRVFYKNLGGITLSGGEPFAQPKLAAELAAEARRRGISATAETCLAVPWSAIEASLANLDAVLADVKHPDPDRYRAGTGGDPDLPRDNLRRLAASGVPTSARVPVVPGFNDDFRDLAAAAEFVAGLGTIKTMHLMPYHSFGEVKYRLLGRERRPAGVPTATPENLAGTAVRLAEAYGLEVRIGG